ncbi:MAG: hypothetical protein Q7S34_01075 [bacterium]|nr:hypothetical protein [bacterium]
MRNFEHWLERYSMRITRRIGSVPSLIIHSILFIGIFVLGWFGLSFDKILLILTTIVSLEAIYLSIFIQLTINRTTTQLQEVEKDIGEIQEDVEEIQEDIEEIAEDEIEEISENAKLEKIEKSLLGIVQEVENLKRATHPNNP